MLPRSCSGHLYEVLQVDPSSSTEDIKRQYHRLALQLHPDRTNGTTTSVFQEVEEAHRILSNPKQRQLYDALGREGLKKLGDFGVPDFLLTVQFFQSFIAALAFLLAMLLLTLVLVAVKLDGPRPTWPWAAVLAPLWVVSPLFAILGALCVVAGVKAYALDPVLFGVQGCMLVVMPAMACAALQGTLRPPSRAFFPFLIFYTCGALRRLYGLVPSAYAERRREADDALRDGGGGDVDSNTSSNASNPSHSPCRSREYCCALFQQILEVVCVAAFASLCFARARQGPARLQDGDDPRKFLSFWVVFAPLIVYYGVLVLMDFVVAFAASGTGRRHRSRFRDVDEGGDVVIVSGEEPTAAAAAVRPRGGGEEEEPYGTGGSRPRTRSGGLPTGSGPRDPSPHEESASSRRLTLCTRLANAVLAPFFHACCLYMVCMWAAKEEVEYNRVPAESVVLHPSVYAATFPLFVALVLPLLLMCCLACAVSMLLRSTVAAAAAEEEEDEGRAEAHSATTTTAAGTTYDSTGGRPRGAGEGPAILRDRTWPDHEHSRAADGRETAKTTADVD